MKLPITPHSAALLAINLLFLIIWGLATFSKIQSGFPSWFPEKFGPTFLASFPGLKATFWLLTISELFGFLLAAVALLKFEFFGRNSPVVLSWMLVWSLFIWCQLSLGQWLTNEFNAAAQLFSYFGLTLFTLYFVQHPPSKSGNG